MSVQVLDREMYTEAEAARLLRVPPSTLHYWLEGGVRRGVAYRPVIRPEPTDRRALTWGEFVEAALLREYRKRQIPMRELRALIDALRDEYGVVYPLAHHEVYIDPGARRLIWRVQEEHNLKPEFCLVAVATGQRLLFTSPSQAFLDRIDWDPAGAAATYRPADDPASPVRMDPRLRFGRPAVAGISTDVIAEQSRAGASHAEIAEWFGLTEDQVDWALSYERALRAA